MACCIGELCSVGLLNTYFTDDDYDKLPTHISTVLVNDVVPQTLISVKRIGAVLPEQIQ